MFGDKRIFNGEHVYPIRDFFGILRMVAMDNFKDILKIIVSFFFPIYHHGYE
jgi:hypothetical protein